MKKRNIKLNTNELNEKYQIESNMRICELCANMRQNCLNLPDYQLIQVMPLFNFSGDSIILKGTVTDI